MKNGQRYAKEINRMVNQEYFECSLWNIRNGKRASEDCCHVPKSFDPVSGSDEFCKKCLGESLEWLNQEYKEPILDDVEREYLSSVIKPFRKKISCIRKSKDPRKGKIILKLNFAMVIACFFQIYRMMQCIKAWNLTEIIRLRS